ncbi:MAG: DUF4340 domain-containing protein [Myxococcales bacterium]|nr:DUF4340 domain-containing protein [Myxococcales bacterium]
MKSVKGQQGVSSVFVHAGLAALAVMFAYQTWTRDRTQTQTDSVVVLDAAKRDVNSLAYEDETRQITVERRAAADGESYAWLLTKVKSKVPVNPPTPPAAAPPATVAPTAPTSPAAKVASPAVPTAKPVAPVKGGEKSGEPPMPAGHPPIPSADPHGVAHADPHAAPAMTQPPVEMKEVTTIKEFRGNDAATELLGLFGPLKALRALGAVDDAKAKELGLTDSKKTLTVNAKGLSYKFVVGGTSYGSGDYYIRDAQGQVFLLSQRIIADFEFSDSRLMERRLHRFERADFDRIEVKVGDKTRTIVQASRQNPQGFFFAEAATPDKRDDSLKNWVEKLLRLSITDFLAQGEEPATSAAAMSGAAKTGELVSVRFFDGRKELGNMVLSRHPNPKTNQPEYYARTETSVTLVRLLAATAESVITDAEKW